MKILYVTGETLAETGGGATHIREVASNFVKLGHEITVLANRDKGEPKETEMNGYRIIRMPLKLKGNTIPLLSIQHVFSSTKYDIILERFSVIGGFGAIASKLFNIPLVLEINGPHLQEAKDLGRISNNTLVSSLNTWIQWQFKQAAKIFVVANSVDDSYKNKLLGRHAHKGIYLRNGAREIDLESAQKNAKVIRKKYKLGDNLVFTFVGSFKPWMGVNNLVQALNHLKENEPKFYQKISVLLVGEGYELQNVQDYVKSHKLDNCIMTGKVSHDEVANYLAATDVCVAPFDKTQMKTMSTFGFYFSPAKIFEYMAAQKPIITTNYPELEDIIAPGKRGLTCPEGNIVALADAMKRMQQKSVRIKCAKNAYALFKKKYTWLECVKKQERIFKELL